MSQKLQIKKPVKIVAIISQIPANNATHDPIVEMGNPYPSKFVKQIGRIYNNIVDWRVKRDNNEFNKKINSSPRKIDYLGQHINVIRYPL
jgi:hypothetical protein